MLRVPFRWRLAALAILLPLVLVPSWICYRALRIRDEAVTESAAAQRVATTYEPVDSHFLSSGELIPAAPSFRDALVFRGKVYLCAASGLYAYDSAGVLVESYRSGRELPAGELVGLAVGRGQQEAELFIATAGAGVLTFDGNHFRQLLPVEKSLRNFTSILGLDTGGMLFGTTNNGTLLWDGTSLSAFLPQLKHAHITALAGPGENIWIGTMADGLWRFHAGQLDHMSTVLPDPHVLSIAISGISAYVGTPVGVAEFRNGRKLRTLAEGYFARSLEADSETLAVGTEDEGIVTIPLRAMAISGNSFNATDIKGPVERILRIAGERYLLAGSLYRLNARMRSSTRVLTVEKGRLSDRNISALNIGQDGRVWIGYFDRGLDVSDPAFARVRHFEDDHLFCVNRVAEDSAASRTAVATANGLVLFDPGLVVRQVLGRKDGLLADHVTDVLLRKNGIVIATPAGLSFANASGVRSLYVFHGLVNNHVYSLASVDNRIAAGTLGGLSLLVKDAVESNYTTANSSLKHNWISALARVGDEWFAGTYGAGVMRLDNSGQWRGFPDLKSGFEVNPNAIAQTGDSVFVGSLGRGLWIYSKAGQRWRNAVVGLPSLNVTAVAAGNGSVYIGTDNGLVRFQESYFR